MIVKRSFLKILLVLLSISFSEIILAEQKSKPPSTYTVIFISVGAIGGFVFGVTQFRNPEHYINLIPLISAPVCAISGAFLMQISYKQLYRLSLHLNRK
jgi:hypothetical protein